MTLFARIVADWRKGFRLDNDRNESNSRLAANCGGGLMAATVLGWAMLLKGNTCHYFPRGSSVSLCGRADHARNGGTLGCSASFPKCRKCQAEYDRQKAAADQQGQEWNGATPPKGRGKCPLCRRIRGKHAPNCLQEIYP